jgi:hypothetical protein
MSKPMLVYVEHPFATDRPFVGMVADREDAIRRFGSRAKIWECSPDEVFVLDPMASKAAVDATKRRNVIQDASSVPPSIPRGGLMVNQTNVRHPALTGETD